MKSGQIRQIFFYIFAIIVAGLILYFGFTLIPKVLTLFCDVETGNLKVSVENEIGKVYNLGFGSFKTLSVPTSCGVEYICFIGNNPDFNKVPDGRPKEIMEVRYQTGNNFFIITTKKNLPVEYLKIENIEIKQGVFCLRPKGNSITFKAENKGDHVEISE